jgi:hypothetical protein
VASRTHFVFLLLLRRRLRLPLLPSVIAIVVAERSISLLFASDSTAAELLDVISVFLVQFGVFFFFLMCDMVHSDVQLLFFWFLGGGGRFVFFVVSVSCMVPISL